MVWNITGAVVAAVGSTPVAGIMILLFFALTLVMFRASLDLALLVMIPAMIGVAYLIPGLRIIVAIGLGIIVGLAFMRVIRR